MAPRGVARATASMVLSLLLGTGTQVAPAWGATSSTQQTYTDTVATAWRETQVYVDPSQGSFLPNDEAERLADRVFGHQPRIFVAVVPAVALSSMPGDDDRVRARAFLAEATPETDGVYIVVFGGAGTYGTEIGTDLPVGEILDGAVGRHTRSAPVDLLDDVLTELGVPGEPESGSRGWVVPVGISAALAVGLVAGLLVVRTRRDRAEVGDRVSGAAPYRPSFDVLPDEMDTLAERQILAREDVTRFGEELQTADVDVASPVAPVAADVQAAMDAYAEVGAAVDTDPDDTVLRAIRSTVEYGRWRLAKAQAALTGDDPPPRRADCFFDMRHGTSVADVMFKPAAGKAREVPVCDLCRDRWKGSGS